MVPLTFSSNSRHYFTLSVCALLGLASLCSLVYGVVRLQKSFAVAEEDYRNKRSATVVKNSGKEQFLFRPALHKINLKRSGDNLIKLFFFVTDSGTK
jgi:hypothetical protein